MMKKILLAVVAVIALCACNGEREYLNYRGMSMGTSAKAMCDSLLLQGLALDTVHSSETTYVLADTLACNFVVSIIHQNDTISDILEQYSATYNDSTSNLWQAMHDDFEKDFGWPNMRHSGDLHKEAFYENDKGTVLLTLLNTYTPSLTVRYSTMTTK
ncbi:MAG: hypothetical protein IJ841_11255 [Prevotella sp.]|nr:hypothetical protein [Prevotella sp.]